MGLRSMIHRRFTAWQFFEWAMCMLARGVFRLLHRSPALGTLLIGMLSARADPPSTIWFCPRYGPPSTSDFMALFQADAPWQRAASAISAFEISDELTYKH